jgi:uncharacterized membrane protein YphA (DoxX/SURF4 family)
MTKTTLATDAQPFSLAQRDPAYRAFCILRVGFALAPIVAGIDKFFHVLTNWDQYLAPVVDRLLAGRGHQFMLVVGVIEIAAGIGVAVKPRFFGYVVAAWLLAIILNLLLMRAYYDIALRDFGLALGALSLAYLSKNYDPAPRATLPP